MASAYIQLHLLCGTLDQGQQPGGITYRGLGLFNLHAGGELLKPILRLRQGGLISSL